MKKTILNLGFAALWLLSFNVNAQEVVSFTDNIQEVRVEPLTGNVFVKTKNGLTSLDPNSKQKIWELDTKNVNSTTTLDKMASAYAAVQNNDFLGALDSNSEIEFIQNSPYAQITFDKNSIIINSLTGQVVFNSATEGYVIYTTSFIPSKNEFLILGQKDKNIDFINYDLDNNKIKWVSNVGTADGFGKELGNLLKSFVKNSISLSENKVEINNGIIYAGIKNLLFAINDETGKILWKTDYPINNFYVNRKGDRVITVLNTGGILSSKKKLNILDATNGNKLWKDDITTKYISYLEDHGDKILIAHHGGFNFYDYEKGNKVWKKDAKGKQIKQVIPLGQDYLYIADTEMNLIDKNGANKWKKFIEIADNSEDEVYYLDNVGNNRVFYLTDTYGNMVDYNTGKKIWRKNIEFDKKRPLAYDVKDDKFLVYNNKRIYTFNTNNEDSPKPKGKIDVKNDKTIETLESFDWGVCIVGQNDVIGLDNEGNTLYHKTYKEPGEAGRRLLKTGGIIGNAYFGSKSSMNRSLSEAKFVFRDEKGNIVQEVDMFSDDAKKRMTKAANEAGNTADIISKNVIANVDKRYNGLKQTNNYAFILARGESGPELVKVRKNDGTEVAKIDLDSNKPMYEIDNFTDNIYYASGNDLKIYK
ncbi:PQQ-binding-like beta-propeller repeat protein [Flavobacterium agricola]|uniref:PQQ-binding-like beta-propeller repeat protein n=1 Tax=Flavobacterium agricola TaxID=2870839 RepID=A0ABY6LYV4_9FLAO|nr:PQQ-binding-like beta-propeller repeat protein [Flavobacterium agricola]UYW01505.1 PQQ-binding-like beta-propeller repeat protein [Flavobacterium agricola]